MAYFWLRRGWRNGALFLKSRVWPGQWGRWSAPARRPSCRTCACSSPSIFRSSQNAWICISSAISCLSTPQGKDSCNAAWWWVGRNNWCGSKWSLRLREWRTSWREKDGNIGSGSRDWWICWGCWVMRIGAGSLGTRPLSWTAGIRFNRFERGLFPYFIWTYSRIVGSSTKVDE